MVYLTKKLFSLIILISSSIPALSQGFGLYIDHQEIPINFQVRSMYVSDSTTYFIGLNSIASYYPNSDSLILNISNSVYLDNELAVSKTGELFSDKFDRTKKSCESILSCSREKNTLLCLCANKGQNSFLSFELSKDSTQVKRLNLDNYCDYIHQVFIGKFILISCDNGLTILHRKSLRRISNHSIEVMRMLEKDKNVLVLSSGKFYSMNLSKEKEFDEVKFNAQGTSDFIDFEIDLSSNLYLLSTNRVFVVNQFQAWLKEKSIRINWRIDIPVRNYLPIGIISVSNNAIYIQYADYKVVKVIFQIPKHKTLNRNNLLLIKYLRIANNQNLEGIENYYYDRINKGTIFELNSNGSYSKILKKFNINTKKAISEIH